MKVKRYIGQNTKEAMQKISDEMGKDAVILNTRKIRQKGIAGFFKKPLVEVVAAVDDHVSFNYRMLQQQMEKWYNQGNEFAVNRNTPAQNTGNASQVIKKLENQIAAINQLVNKLTDGVNIIKNTSILPVKPAFLPYYERLIENEVNESIAKAIIEEAEKIYDREGIEPENCLNRVLLRYIGPSRPLQIPDNQRKTVMFIGPTGVGKTTSLAKMAAIYSIKQQMKVGLITADTYRIAAVDQLKIYAEILEIPLSILYSPKEIVPALEEHKDKDVVFIDTAGKSIRDRVQEEEIMELINLSKADEIYLVISCNTSCSGCKNIIDSYSFLPDFKLFFTKIDEASNIGTIINCRYMTGKPISYITTGQNVPDDIEIADPDKLLSYMDRRYKDRRVDPNGPS